MNRNSNTLFLESPNAITPVPWVNNAPDFTGFTEPTLSVLQDAYQANINNIVIIPDPITEPPSPPQPDPKGFYEKLIGVRGDYPLHQVYQSISFQALNPDQDTSSLNFAITVFNSALNINDWSKDYAKTAYAQAYNILKSFLSVGQITIIDAENINFNLV